MIDQQTTTIATTTTTKTKTSPRQKMAGSRALRQRVRERSGWAGSSPPSLPQRWASWTLDLDESDNVMTGDTDPRCKGQRRAVAFCYWKAVRIRTSPLGTYRSLRVSDSRSSAVRRAGVVVLESFRTTKRFRRFAKYDTTNTHT
jgi:hypothetical protein